MSLVLDASVVLAWLLPDEHSAQADQIIENLASAPAHAPSLLLPEVANVLVQAERRARVPTSTTGELLTSLLALPLLLDPIDAGAIERALPLARAHGLSIYDALYLELAQQRQLPLATFDDVLRRAADGLGIDTLAGD